MGATAVNAWSQDLVPEGSPKVYAGEEGVRVTLVTLKPRSAHRVLVKVEGSDSDLDGKIFLHEVREYGNNKADFARKRGEKQYVTITAREGWWSSKEYQLYPPGRKDSVAI